MKSFVSFEDCSYNTAERSVETLPTMKLKTRDTVHRIGLLLAWEGK
jgi:hypothetical protein